MTTTITMAEVAPDEVLVVAERTEVRLQAIFDAEVERWNNDDTRLGEAVTLLAEMVMSRGKTAPSGVLLLVLERNLEIHRRPNGRRRPDHRGMCRIRTAPRLRVDPRRHHG